MPKIKKDEYYILQPLPAPNLVRMTKFVNDEPIEESSYNVGPAQCQCFQAGRGQCRHMIMHHWWKVAGFKPLKMRFFPPDTVTWEPLTDEMLL